MKVFFDTEFTGLRKDTTLISIGMITEDGQKFYAELTDYDESMCDDWIKENVLNNLFLHNGTPDDDGTYMIGNKKEVGAELVKWLDHIPNIMFASDVCHYDMVLLVDLLTNGGSALDIPPNIPVFCHDINQDIARNLAITETSAFEVDREKLANMDGDKHNALHDAEVIKKIWEIIC